MSNAYVYQMPSGIPGNVTRVTSYPNIESQILDQTSPPTAFGIAVSMSSGKIILYPASVSTQPYGILVRPYPTSGNGTDGLGTATPDKRFPADVLISGYINVKVQTSTAPAKNGTVYIRNANATTGQVLGGIEAVSTANNFPLVTTGGAICYFTGGMDANGNAEIAYNV